MVCFGQIVVGPPGSGKTTYCYGMQQFLSGVLHRNCAIINLDFANDIPPYKPMIDVRDLISIETVMNDLNLGPNGGLKYCMEYLMTNLDWLIDEIMKLSEEVECPYFIFDCPGQVELYTHHTSMQQILKELQNHDIRLCGIQLIDSFYCTQPATFISATLLATFTMLRLGLPQVNILSKIDLLKNYGPLPFNLNFFTEMNDLTPMIQYIDDPPGKIEDTSSNPKTRRGMPSKLSKMSELICEVINDFGLLQFHPLNIQDPETVGHVVSQIDLANGYSFVAKTIMDHKKSTANGDEESQKINSLFQFASQHLELSFERSLQIQERYGIEEI